MIIYNDNMYIGLVVGELLSQFYHLTQHSHDMITKLGNKILIMIKRILTDGFDGKRNHVIICRNFKKDNLFVYK